MGTCLCCSLSPMERAIAVTVFRFNDSGIYADPEATSGLAISAKRDCIFPDEESRHPGSNGNVLATLRAFENEFREEMDGKHPQSCEPGQVEAGLSLAWLSEVRRCLESGDIDAAVRNAIWLGVCRERMRVVRLEGFALQAKWQRVFQRKGGEATKKLTEEQQRTAVEKVNYYVNDSAMTRTDACKKVARESKQLLGKRVSYKTIERILNRSE